MHAGKVPPQAPTVVEVELEVEVEVLLVVEEELDVELEVVDVDSVGDVLVLVEEVVVTDSVVDVVEVTTWPQTPSPSAGAYSQASQRSLATSAAPPAPPLLAAPISAASSPERVLLQKPPSRPSLSGLAAVSMPSVSPVSVSVSPSRRRTA